LALTSRTSGGSSVGIVHLRITDTEFFLFLVRLTCTNNITSIGSEVLTGVVVGNVIWVVKSCRSVLAYRHFGEIYRFHLQDPIFPGVFLDPGSDAFIRNFGGLLLISNFTA
jgi:hypothetical protein